MGDQQNVPKWGDPISSIPEERQVELRALHDQQEEWAKQEPRNPRESPFAKATWRGGVGSVIGANIRALTGAEVFFLAVYVYAAGHGGDLEEAVTLFKSSHNVYSHIWIKVSRLHLEGANLSGAYLEGAILSGAYLEGAILSGTHLEGADLNLVQFDGKTDLSQAVLMEEKDTRPWHSRLLRRPRFGPALGDIRWGDFDLMQLTQLRGWERTTRLADERSLGRAGVLMLFKNQEAVRAYRQVAQRLRDQGYSDIADRFSERAQVRQRKLYALQFLDDWWRPWRVPGNLLRWLFSWFLAILAGYGYHPGRSVFWYLASVVGFAALFFQASHGVLTLGLSASQVQPLHWYEALVLSVSSFHGRGFFQPTGPNGLGDPVAILAAGEAVIGLLIEISFIATFTQRFFAR